MYTSDIYDRNRHHNDHGYFDQKVYSISLFQDRYILAAMVMLTVICVWHGLQTKIDAADKKDYVALVVLAGLYLLYNLQFFIRILLVVSWAYFYQYINFSRIRFCCI